MKIIEIINGPWAITPEMLQELQSIYATHLRGDKIDLEAVEAAIGRSLDNSRNGSWVQDNVAIIPIDGVIGKRMNLFTQISGGTSSQILAEDYEKAMNDPSIKGIVLHVDSPGGTVDGTQQASDLMASYRGQKPVVACADGLMASAAYWLGSNADEIYIADETTDVGSIGVVAKHMDISGYEEKNGIKTTEITAGKYKRAVSQYMPLSDEGRALIQADLDQIYALFVETVAKNRETDVAAVLENMADGRTFLGRNAIDAGLVDGVATLAESIERVKDLAVNNKPGRAGVASANHSNAEEQNMNIETLKAEHPDLFKQVQDEAREGMVSADDVQSQVEAARAEGAENERKRINDVRGQMVAGHEDLIEKLAFDGESTGADAAMAIVAAEQKRSKHAAADIDADANAPAPPSGADELGEKTMKRKDFNALGISCQRAFIHSGGKVVD